jgi:acetoin utilization protein AcuC
MLDRDVDPDVTLPREWTDYVDTIAPNAELPSAMNDGKSTDFDPWDGDIEQRVDNTIRDTRRAVFPLHGLDPDDPRD